MRQQLKSFIKAVVATGLCLGVAVTPVAALTSWLKNPGFNVAAKQVIDQANICYAGAPWNSSSKKSWGAEGSTLDSADHKLDWVHFSTFSDSSNNTRAYMYGKETRGYWGFVRYIQGNAWGSNTNCGTPVPWKVPPVLRLNNNGVIRQLTLKVNLYRDAYSFNLSDGWVMYAFDVWIKSPKLSRPIVLDLVVFHDTNNGAPLRNYIDANLTAYHYQKKLGSAPQWQWSNWRVDLDNEIKKALHATYATPSGGTETLNVGVKTASIYQVEFLIEVHGAEGAATIDNFNLQY